MEPRPFIIQRNNKVVDRKTGSYVGRIRLTSDGWVVQTALGEYGPWHPRHQVVRDAWEAWKASMKPASSA